MLGVVWCAGFVEEKCLAVISAADAVHGVDMVGNPLWKELVSTLQADFSDLFSCVDANVFHAVSIKNAPRLRCLASNRRVSDCRYLLLLLCGNVSLSACTADRVLRRSHCSFRPFDPLLLPSRHRLLSGCCHTPQPRNWQLSGRRACCPSTLGCVPG